MKNYDELIDQLVEILDPVNQCIDCLPEFPTGSYTRDDIVKKINNRKGGIEQAAFQVIKLTYTREEVAAWIGFLYSSKEAMSIGKKLLSLVKETSRVGDLISDKIFRDLSMS